MIDIHAHILPGVDDGAPDQNTTMQMLEMARHDGITAIVATPHADARYNNDAASCRRAIDVLARTMLPAPLLYSGCELHLTPESLDSVLSTPSRFTINGGNTLLLELPDQVPLTSVTAAVEILLDCGIRPVIAHPERNPLFQTVTAAVRVTAAGAYLQITAQSLAGAFGSRAQQSAWALLKNRLVHVVASDCHALETRWPLLSAAYKAVKQRYGRSAAELLFVENPRACIMGDAIRRMPAKSFLFWKCRVEPVRITRGS